MGRKKKGASLITVVVVFAILITLGTATLSLTATDYNLRVGESNRVKNLYYSESGIDITYGVMGKLVERAIKEGNKAVDTFMSSLNGDDGILATQRKQINDKTITVGTYVNSDGTINEESIKNAQNNAFKIAFKNYLTDSIANADGTTESRIIFCMENNIYYDDTNAVVQMNFQANEKPSIAVDGSKIRTFDVNDKLQINITSSFNTVTTSTSIANQPFQRKVSTAFTINTPNYNDTFYVETNELAIKLNPALKKAIAIDGDMTINGNFVVDGDVFVMGNGSSVSDKVYDKYKGGIMIQGNNGDSRKVQFKGTVATNSSFNIRQTNTVEVIPSPRGTNSQGMLYASNVYVGKSNSTASDASNCKLNVTGQVITSNDLSLNAQASSINIDEFYGVNDLSSATDIRNTLSEERKSSSIIVNTDDIDTNSSITINNKAYIMGSAYIKTDPAYQTGESVSVKGNYVAYANELSGQNSISAGLNSSNVYFGYYNPLQLVDKYNNSNNKESMSVDKKAAYFKLYSDETGNRNIKGKGIKLPADTASIGAYLSNNNGALTVNESTYLKNQAANESTIKGKKEEYAVQVFEMGNESGITSKIDKYDSGVVEKYVSNQVLFSQAVNDTNFADDNIIINNDESKTVVIYGKNSTPVTNDSSIIPINATSGQAKGIIITKGNVIIKGEVNFTGSIIAAGNFTSEDNYLKTITCDSNYIKNLVAYNYNKFKDLFDNSNVSPDNQNVEINAAVAKGESDTGHSISTDKLITKKLWRILK